MLVSCGVVHLDPSWINVLLRALLDHRVVDPTERSWWNEQFTKYDEEHSIPFDELAIAHKNFIRTGRLTEKYLQFLWRDVPELSDAHVFTCVLSTLSEHGAVFRCDHDVEEFMVPARLPARVVEDAFSELQSRISNGVGMQFVIEIHSDYVPAGLISQFLGSFRRSSHIVFRACWTAGAAFVMGGMEHLVCLHDPISPLPRRIEIDIAGTTQETVYEPGFAMRDRLFNLLKERFPGLSLDPTPPLFFMDGKKDWQANFSSLQVHLEGRIDKVCPMCQFVP